MEENTPNTGSKLKGTLGGQRAGTDSTKEPVSWNPEPVAINPEPAVTDPKPAYNFDPKTGRPLNPEVRNPAATLYGPPPVSRTTQPAYNFDPKTGRPINPATPVYPVNPVEPVKKTGLLIGLIAGGVALIAVVVLLLVFVGRKKELNPAEFVTRCREIGFKYVDNEYGFDADFTTIVPTVVYEAENLQGTNSNYDVTAYHLTFADVNNAKSFYGALYASVQANAYNVYSGSVKTQSGKNWDMVTRADSGYVVSVMRVGKTLICVSVDAYYSGALSDIEQIAEQVMNDLTK